MAFSLFLSSASDHNYNASLRLFSLPAMFASDLLLPSPPPNAVRETNLETLRRLGHDLALLDQGELTAVDAYRLFGNAADGRPSLGHCLEAARVNGTN